MVGYVIYTIYTKKKLVLYIVRYICIYVRPLEKWQKIAYIASPRKLNKDLYIILVGNFWWNFWDFCRDFWCRFSGIFGADFLRFLAEIFVGDFWRVWGFLSGLGIFGEKWQKWSDLQQCCKRVKKLGFDILSKFVIF